MHRAGPAQRFHDSEYHVVEAAAARRGRHSADRRYPDKRANARLRELAGNYGMAALVEVHDGDELGRASQSGAEIIGVNNRNLHTFEVTLETSLRLAERIPAGRAESERKRHRNRAVRSTASRRRVSGVPRRRAPDAIRLGRARRCSTLTA